MSPKLKVSPFSEWSSDDDERIDEFFPLEYSLFW